MTADPELKERLERIQISALVVGGLGSPAASGGMGDLAGPLFSRLSGWISLLAGNQPGMHRPYRCCITWWGARGDL